jgi:hypothetical protein
MSVLVDGYTEGPGCEIDWHMVDDDLHRYMNGWLAAPRHPRRAGHLRADGGFWPTADQDPAAPPPIIEFAQSWRDMPKVSTRAPWTGYAIIRSALL